jgi:AcrR family transcriptional regulator
VSPRPRSIDDADILAACQRVMQRVGPARFTLARVADEADVSAATLVQRFGSKRKMLRAMTDQVPGYAAAAVKDLRQRHGSALAVAREHLLCFAQMARTPREMAHHLAYLQLDLTDPVMHRNFVAMSNENLSVVGELLAEAVAAGELRAHDTQHMARVLLALVTGALLAWATHRTGTARDWLAEDIDLALAPYRSSRTPGTRRRRRKPA